MSVIRTILDEIEALFQRIRDEVSPHQTSSDAADHLSRAASALQCHPDAEPEAPEAGTLAAQTDEANLKAAGLSGAITDDSKASAKVSDAKFSEDQG
jgi:hypothetical protein